MNEKLNSEKQGGKPFSGKFKTTEALLAAYSELEREFTRRSVRLKELEAEIVAVHNSAEKKAGTPVVVAEGAEKEAGTPVATAEGAAVYAPSGEKGGGITEKTGQDFINPDGGEASEIAIGTLCLNDGEEFEAALKPQNLEDGDASKFMPKSSNRMGEEAVKSAQSLDNEAEKAAQPPENEGEEIVATDRQPIYLSENWRARTENFFAEYPSAVPYAREIAAIILDDPALAARDNCLEAACLRVFSGKPLSAEAAAASPEIVSRVLSREDVKDKILAEYIIGIKGARPPVIMSSGGGQHITPPAKPKTFEEAGKLFLGARGK
ncbi:MAG: hypothetical protein LBT55_07440 [Clostridiaceae bacterium]|jgi:hypothetical protein|nr:hypothetical protein [Clostridiaceae bacterium]